MQKYTETTELELYVLSSQIPMYLKTSGVPLELLKLPSLVPAWMVKKANEIPTDRSGHIANALFHDKRLQYDIWTGYHSHFGSASSSQQDTYLGLDLWLSDLNDIDRRSKDSSQRYDVNCADLAYLVEAIASLAIPNDTNLSAYK